MSLIKEIEEVEKVNEVKEMKEFNVSDVLLSDKESLTDSIFSSKSSKRLFTLNSVSELIFVSVSNSVSVLDSTSTLNLTFLVDFTSFILKSVINFVIRIYKNNIILFYFVSQIVFRLHYSDKVDLTLTSINLKVFIYLFI